MKKIFYLAFSLTLFACSNESNSNDHLENEIQTSHKINEYQSKKTEDIKIFEAGFIAFNENVSKFGKEKAELIIKQQAIDYLTVNNITFDENQKPEELVMTVLKDINNRNKN